MSFHQGPQYGYLYKQVRITLDPVPTQHLVERVRDCLAVSRPLPLKVLVYQQKDNLGLYYAILFCLRIRELQLTKVKIIALHNYIFIPTNKVLSIFKFSYYYYIQNIDKVLDQLDCIQVGTIMGDKIMVDNLV